MLINGVLTNEGLAKAVAVVGSSGLGIVPTGFGVASTVGAGGIANTRTYASRVPAFYSAPLSNYADLGNGQIRFLATIPISANGLTALTPIAEIYIEGTLSGVPFLLMVAAPTTPTTYDPQGSLSFELTTQVLGTNLATAITFNSSQALEITAHETNPVFHPKHTESNVAPTVADDASRGYVVGSTWLHIPTGQEYTCFSVAAGAAHWVASIQTTEKAAPNGVATLNAAGNPVQGLNARNGRCVPLPTTFDLNTLDSNYPSGIYDGFNLTNAPAIGWLYIELIKHVNWTGTNRWATVRATTFGSGNTANIIYERTVSNGVWSAWDKIQTSIDKGVANGLATLDAAGKLVQMPLPADIGLGNVNNTSDVNKPVSTAQQAALNGKEPKNPNIQNHIASTANPHGVTKAQVGLGNVNNTSDVSKPVSTAQQAALDGKENVSVGGGVSFPQHGLAANNGLAVTLPVDTALDALSVTYPSGLYEVNLTVAQLGLPVGWWYIDYKRHSSDGVVARFYSLTSYPLDIQTSSEIYRLFVVNSTAYGFTRVDATAQARADAAYALASSNAGAITALAGVQTAINPGVTYTNTNSFPVYVSYSGTLTAQLVATKAVVAWIAIHVNALPIGVSYSKTLATNKYITEIADFSLYAVIPPGDSYSCGTTGAGGAPGAYAQVAY